MRRKCTIAQAKNGLPRLIHEVERGEPVELTRRGVPVAVLVSAQEYTRLAGERSGFWLALQDFRGRVDPAILEGMEEVFEGLRDQHPGRETGL